MKTRFGEAELTLAHLLALSIRGPKRNSLFAVWLFLRICGGAVGSPSSADRSRRKRLQNLEHRVKSLTMPVTMRRAIRNSIKHLQEHGPDDIPGAVEHLVSPTRETLGPRAADALTAALRIAQDPA